MRRSFCRAIAVGLMCVLPAAAFNPLVGDYTRSDDRDVRVLSYNHGRNFMADTGLDEVFGRILTTIDPDVICFQEFTGDVSDAAIVSRLNALIPIEGGATWHVHSGQPTGIRTVLASRFALSLKRTDTFPGSSTRGVTIALVDLPNAHYAVDLYVLGVHLKCCGAPGGPEDESRQASADAIINWLGDARGVTRPLLDVVSLPHSTPMLVLGDFNLVGGPQPELTLITGDIQNETLYGSDVAGDWDDTAMLDVAPADPFTGNTFTWQGNDNFPPGRLDRFFLTDSAADIAAGFVLNADTMNAAALTATGLEADDTLPSRASDHLPLVIDLRLWAQPGIPTATDFGMIVLIGLVLIAGTVMLRRKVQGGTPRRVGDQSEQST